MRVLLFGATGMVGQGFLRECLLDASVSEIVVVSRRSKGERSPKLHEIVRPNLDDLSGLDSQLAGIDACFFCVGVSSFGMSETEYRHITHDLTLNVAKKLVALNNAMTFLYISGAGTDSTEVGRTMWARVKGATENALLQLPFKRAFMLRPGVIVPLHGIQSRTALYRRFYRVLGPILPFLRKCFPRYVTTTEQLGRAMLRLARDGASKPVLESIDINRL